MKRRALIAVLVLVAGCALFYAGSRMQLVADAEPWADLRAHCATGCYIEPLPHSLLFGATPIDEYLRANGVPECVAPEKRSLRF